MGSVHDPFFHSVIATEFRRHHIADLAAGRCAAIRVPHFLAAATCAEILDALSNAQTATEQVYPPVFRLGTGISDHRANGGVADSYWAAADMSREDWHSLELSFDPFYLCRRALAKNWPNRVEVGIRGGRQLAPGVAREPHQDFQVHFDDALREFSGNLLDANLVAQFAFHLYLSVPERGGQTIIWRHRWSPEDEAYRLPHSPGYRREVVGTAESLELTPYVGEAVLFDPRNFHAVLPSHGSRRIALGFAVGLTDTGDLLTWG